MVFEHAQCVAAPVPGPLAAPEVTRALASQRVVDGSPTVLECTVTGNPPPTMYWFKDAAQLSNTAEFAQFQDEGVCSLVIKETFPEDTGRYTLVAKNSQGTATCSGDLVILGSPY